MRADKNEVLRLREALDQMRRERDRALIAASLHICYGGERTAAPAADGHQTQDADRGTE